MTENINVIPSDWTEENAKIKVIGVGGGGCNAVSYMFEQGIQGCSFIVCNTDSQSLAKSEVPNKLQLGEGLGAGTNPSKARNAAIQDQERIEAVLGSDTDMLFITAGLGGGTGTGASPVIAKIAKDKGILTVAVVTLPFRNEGEQFMAKAIDGVHELQDNVDSILIIDNEKLYTQYGKLLVQDAFPMADNIIATAVRSIMEIVTKTGFINVDFEDVKTMMKDSGLSLMGCGEGSGAHRIEDAVNSAMSSPLFNDFNLRTCRNLLLNVTASNSDKGLSMEEFGRIGDLAKEYIGDVEKSKKGLIYSDDPDFGDKVKITAIATGFKMNLVGITGMNAGKLIMIDKDYKPEIDEYNPAVAADGEEIELPHLGDEDIEVHKIGFNTSLNVRKFHFPEDERPALAIGPGESRSALENEAAIRRNPKNSGE